MSEPLHVRTGYTAGETAALIAPLAGMTADNLAAYLIVAVGLAGQLSISSNLDDRAAEIALAGHAVAYLASDLPGGESL